MLTALVGGKLSFVRGSKNDESEVPAEQNSGQNYGAREAVFPIERFVRGKVVYSRCTLPMCPHSSNSPEINESLICTSPTKKTRNKKTKN